MQSVVYHFVDGRYKRHRHHVGHARHWYLKGLRELSVTAFLHSLWKRLRIIYESSYLH